MLPLLKRPGRFAVIGSGENLWDVVHVDDVATACALAIESAPDGAIFHCADDVPTTYREFMTRVAQAAGTGPPRSLPIWLARIVAGSGPVTTVVRSGRTSNAKLKTQLGWQPRYPDSREGIPAAVAALGARRRDCRAPEPRPQPRVTACSTFLVEVPHRQAALMRQQPPLALEPAAVARQVAA